MASKATLNAKNLQALDLLWRFQDLAEGIYERCDDSSGRIGDVLRATIPDFGAIAAKVKPDAKALADRIYDSLTANHYGEYDNLIDVLAPSLGAQGLARLKERFSTLASEPARKINEEDRRIVGYGSGGALGALPRVLPATG